VTTLLYWDDYNEDHIAEHGVTRVEAEYVVLHPGRGYPADIGGRKHLVWGQDGSGRYLQVIYVYRAVETVDMARFQPADRLRLGGEPEVAYVIHARPLNERERRQLRRRSR